MGDLSLLGSGASGNIIDLSPTGLQGVEAGDLAQHLKMQKSVPIAKKYLIQDAQNYLI